MNASNNRRTLPGRAKTRSGIAGFTAMLLWCSQIPALMAGTPAPDLPEAGSPPQQISAAQASPELTETWLEVTVNEIPAPHAMLMLQGTDEQLFIRRDDLAWWDFDVSSIPSTIHAGEDYVALANLPGVSYELDPANLSLQVTAGPSLFTLTEFGGMSEQLPVPMRSPSGGFFNYDIFTSYSDGSSSSSGLLEAGWFIGSGVGITSMLLKNQPELSTGAAEESFSATRLDTTWTSDFPSMRTSLRLGDAIGSAGSWGRSVRFAGAQWATNFATQPGFITFPLPDMGGEAAVPSTLDLYVNGILRMRQEVPTGPFTVNNLPLVTGQGDVQIVLRDLLGREQVFNGNFYASSLLLKRGLSDFSYEIGSIRDSYGLESFDYGRWMAAGTYRRGLSDQLTGELRAELLADQQSLGVSGAYLLGDLGVLRSSLAGSHGPQGNGGLVGVGFERSSLGLSFGFSTQLASRNFVQLGQPEDKLAPKQLSQVFVSLPLRHYGSVSLNYINQQYRDRESFESAGISYQVSLGKLGFLNASAMRLFGEEGSTLYALTFTRSLGRNTTGNASYNRDSDSSQLLVQVQRNLPVGNGFGYRLAADALDTSRSDAQFSAQSNYGTYAANMSRFNGRTTYSAGASGGMALLDGQFHLSRRISDSFAVVKVGDYANVRVYADNQEVARTRKDGTALLPRLRAYQENPVSVELADLPLDAQIDGQALKPVPYFRSGLALDFPIRRARGAIISVVLDNGEPLPVGFLLTRISDQQQFVTGLRGEVYLTGMAENELLRVRWKGQSCEFTVHYPETDDPLPSLGDHLCAGVKP